MVFPSKPFRVRMACRAAVSAATDGAAAEPTLLRLASKTAVPSLRFGLPTIRSTRMSASV